jgi:hypothetical protein
MSIRYLNFKSEALFLNIFLMATKTVYMYMICYNPATGICEKYQYSLFYSFREGLLF